MRVLRNTYGIHGAVDRYTLANDSAAGLSHALNQADMQDYFAIFLPGIHS